MKLEIYVDGACSGNPGPAAIGVVIKRDNKTIKELAKSIGEATNNIAEYTAVVYALQEALILRATDVLVNTDSELVSCQLNGTYKVTHPQLILLFDQIKHMKAGFRSFTIQHVRREKNQDADRLAREAIKAEQVKMVASRKKKESQMDFVSDSRGEESPSSKG